MRALNLCLFFARPFGDLFHRALVVKLQPASERISQHFLGKTSDEFIFLFADQNRLEVARPLNSSPLTSSPAGSMVKFSSFSRQAPMPLKFSIPNPIGSMRRGNWRNLGSPDAVPFAGEAARQFGLFVLLQSGTFGGGGGGGVPRIFSRIHFPRFTGRCALDWKSRSDTRVGQNAAALSAFERNR